MRRFVGKVVLVTGSSSGIGAACVRRFLSEGARVACLDLPGTAAASPDPDSMHLGCDVSDESAVIRALSATVDRFGRIDAAVLSAGTEGKVAPLETTRVEDFDRVQAVNVRGMFLGMKHLIPAMRRAGGGAIIALASTAGLRGSRAGLGPYTASKHAVIGLVKTAALEAAKDGIRVNAVCPAPVDTPMMRAIEAGNDASDPASMRARIEASVPLGRYAEPEEIAGLIAYLASDEARYLTGASYLADGGVMA